MCNITERSQDYEQKFWDSVVWSLVEFPQLIVARKSM